MHLICIMIDKILNLSEKILSREKKTDSEFRIDTKYIAFPFPLYVILGIL